MDEKIIENRKINKYLNEIATKMIVVYDVYVDEVNSERDKRYAKTALKEQIESQEIIKDLKLCLLCSETPENGKTQKPVLPMIKKLNSNFDWAFRFYENCVIRTGVADYAKDVSEQKEKFKTYFNEIKIWGEKEDANNKSNNKTIKEKQKDITAQKPARK